MKETVIAILIASRGLFVSNEIEEVQFQDVLEEKITPVKPITVSETTDLLHALLCRLLYRPPYQLHNIQNTHPSFLR